jgi:CRP/FNR family cyclic AMP-dependent transcriptional regulator
MDRLIRVLDHLPELAGGLRGAELAAAHRGTIAVAERVPRGPWAPRGGMLAGVVHDGLLVRQTTATALVGPGDLLPPLSPPATWRVLEPATVVWLGTHYEQAARRWPALSRSLLALAQEGTERALVLQGIARLQRVDERLLALLWHLAERWGRVCPDGVILRLRLQHRLLADLVGARRPSVTTALGQLAAEGRVARTDDGAWLLRGMLDEPAGTLLELSAAG